MFTVKRNIVLIPSMDIFELHDLLPVLTNETDCLHAALLTIAFGQSIWLTIRLNTWCANASQIFVTSSRLNSYKMIENHHKCYTGCIEMWIKSETKRDRTGNSQIFAHLCMPFEPFDSHFHEHTDFSSSLFHWRFSVAFWNTLNGAWQNRNVNILCGVRLCYTQNPIPFEISNECSNWRCVCVRRCMRSAFIS